MRVSGIVRACTAGFTSSAKTLLSLAIIAGWVAEVSTVYRAFGQEAICRNREICSAQESAVPLQDDHAGITLKILLVQFADVECRKTVDGRSPRYSSQDFEQLLGSEGIYVSPGMYSPDGEELFGSMNDYYRAMSGKRLTIKAHLINRIDSVQGTPVWISLGKTKAQYHQSALGDSPIFVDALRAAGEAGLDVSTSDDAKLAIIYAGNTYFLMGGLNPMASGFCYIMSEVQGRPYNQEHPGATFSRIGLHCHEFAHTIGIGHSTGGRADLMYGGTANGSVEGNAPAPFNAIVRMRMGWATVIPADSLGGASVDTPYSLTTPTIFTMKNRKGDQFFVENRRFDQTMTIGSTTVPDYNNAEFFPPAGPHGTISQGILVWRWDSYGDVRDPGYSTQGLISASGRYGRTFPENEPSDTDDGVPFPGVSNRCILSPWSDPRNPYLKEADSRNPGIAHYNLFVPNTKGGSSCAMEILSENRQQGTFRIKFYTSTPPNPELANQPSVGAIGAYEGRRTICRGDSCIVHQVLNVGGEVFYRRSIDDGVHWQKTYLLSSGNGGNSAPCLAIAGTTILVVWQVQASGADAYVLHLTRSTDGGESWAGVSSPGRSYGCGAPGPYPLIAGASDSSALLVYRTNDLSLVSCVSKDAGISWGSLIPVPQDSMAWTSVSLLMTGSLLGETAAHLVYCSSSLSGPGQVLYNSFDLAAGTWGSPDTVTGILPARYVDAQDPTLAYATEGDLRELHVVWETRDSYPGSEPVIAMRKIAGLRSDATYTILRGRSQTEMSMTSWTTLLADEVSRGRYSRLLTLSEAGSDAALSVELGAMSLSLRDGSIDSLQIAKVPEHRTGLDRALLIQAGRSIPFTVNTDADSLNLMVPISGNDPRSLFSSLAGFVGLQIVREGSDSVIATVLRRSAVSIADDERHFMRVSFSLAGLRKQLEGHMVSIRLVVQGLREDIELAASLGHVYSTGAEDPVGRVAVVVEKAAAPIHTPQTFALQQNYPNPFNPSTTIEYALPHSVAVTLKVYNMLGEEVAVLVDGEQPVGKAMATWDASDMPSGAYIYRLTAGEHVQTKKAILVK